MDKKELRIGNFIYNDIGTAATICTIGKNTIEVDLGNGWCTVFAPRPIELTEQWLINFGFEKSGNIYRKSELDFGTTISNSFDGWVISHVATRKSIKYVHELQNIYFDTVKASLVKMTPDYKFIQTK